MSTSAARVARFAGYVKAFAKAAEKLQKQRFLLEEDVQRYIAEAEASEVLVGVPAGDDDD